MGKQNQYRSQFQILDKISLHTLVITMVDIFIITIFLWKKTAFVYRILNKSLLFPVPPDVISHTADMPSPYTPFSVVICLKLEEIPYFCPIWQVFHVICHFYGNRLRTGRTREWYGVLWSTLRVDIAALRTCPQQSTSSVTNTTPAQKLRTLTTCTCKPRSLSSRRLGAGDLGLKFFA